LAAPLNVKAAEAQNTLVRGFDSIW